MSLNIAAEGFTFMSAAQTTAVFTVAMFDGGDADIMSETLQAQLDTSAGDIDLAGIPSPITLGVCPGASMTVVKNSTDGNKIIYTDPVTNIAYSYVNKQGESITLKADNVNDQWVVKP